VFVSSDRWICFGKIIIIFRFYLGGRLPMLIYGSDCCARESCLCVGCFRVESNSLVKVYLSKVFVR